MQSNQLDTKSPIHFVRTGPRGGTPIVFIHALGLDSSIWEHQVQEFGRDHDVICVDLPGHGLSEHPQAGPSFHSFAKILRDFLIGLGLGPVDVVGISVGGMVAQALAIDAPAMVHSLSLVATNCTFTEEVRGVLRKRAQTAREEGMAALAPLHLQRWFAPDFLENHPDLRQHFIELLLRQANGYHADMWEMVASIDFEQQLAVVKVPVMVIAGQDDVSAPPAAGQRIVDRVAGSALHVFPRCVHFPPIEYPAEFNELLRRFLDRR